MKWIPQVGKKQIYLYSFVKFVPMHHPVSTLVSSQTNVETVVIDNQVHWGRVVTVVDEKAS